jgi:hypothetical protein
MVIIHDNDTTLLHRLHKIHQWAGGCKPLLEGMQVNVTSGKGTTSAACCEHYGNICFKLLETSHTTLHQIQDDINPQKMSTVKVETPSHDWRQYIVFKNPVVRFTLKVTIQTTESV